MRNKQTLDNFEEFSAFEYAKRLAQWEYDVSSFDGDGLEDEQRKIKDYMASTALRWKFTLQIILAAMDDAYLPVGSIRKKLGASRAAVDTMINECEDAKWIKVKRNKQNHRSVKATELTVKSWINYSRWCSKQSLKLDLSFYGMFINRVHSK